MTTLIFECWTSQSALIQSVRLFCYLFLLFCQKSAKVTLSSLAAVALTTRPGTMAVKDSTKHTPQLHARLRGEIPFRKSIQSLDIFSGFYHLLNSNLWYVTLLSEHSHYQASKVHLHKVRGSN